MKRPLIENEKAALRRSKQRLQRDFNGAPSRVVSSRKEFDGGFARLTGLYREILREGIRP